MVQKVTFLDNTDNVNFGWFAYDSTDGHQKKCYPILNHAIPQPLRREASIASIRIRCLRAWPMKARPSIRSAPRGTPSTSMKVENPMQENPELTRWNGRFSASGYVFGTEPNVFLASQAARLKPGLQALSIADGEGRNGVWLASQGLDVTSFDFSPAGVEKARRLAQLRGVAASYHPGVAELAEWDWDARQYDIIAAIFIQFTAPAERARMFAGICRALKPGGLLLLEGYRPEQIPYGTGGPKVPEQMYTVTLLREAFAALEILELHEYDREIDEGEGHGGMSALIDLVARRPA